MARNMATRKGISKWLINGEIIKKDSLFQGDKCNSFSVVFNQMEISGFQKSFDLFGNGLQSLSNGPIR